MKHARPDYDRIQDPDHLIPDAEPVFLIRGQDAVGAAAVRIWAILNEMQEGGDPELTARANAQALMMETWHTHKPADL